MFRKRTLKRVAEATPSTAGIQVRQDAAARHTKGFTLVELMITLAVAGVLMMIAIPSFRHVTMSNRLSTTANDLVDSINTARMEAVKRNNYAQFCSGTAANNGTDTLGLACNAGTVAHPQGAVVLMENSATNTTYLAQDGTDKITAPVQLSSPIVAIRFDGQGVGHPIGSTGTLSGTIADICSSTISQDNHRVIAITTGTIVTTTTTTGACP